MVSVAAGIAEEAALDALDEALAAQLIRVRGGATYEFQHALFGQAVYALLNPSRQERLHRRIAEAIVQIRGRRANEDAGAVAEQYARSRTVPGAEAGISYALAAASHAERAAAFEARVRFLQIALDLTPRGDSSYPRTLGLLATAYAATSRFTETVERTQQACRMIAETEGDEAAATFIELAPGS